jgi:hypothetical protein
MTYIKSAELYECNICDFICFKKSDWNRHITTIKHKKLHNKCEYVEDNLDTIVQNNYYCECGNKYKHRQSLYNHKKKCITAYNNNNNEDEKTDKELMILLLKDNTELKQMILEVVKNGLPANNTNTNNSNNTINNHNTTNNNNNQFNLNFFLNETCKDAMNISDFVEQLPIYLSDLEETARLGFAEGITRIFTRGLKELDVNKRPIHCSDGKRETLYIKDNDKWEKDDSNKSKLETAVRKVGTKNIRLIPEWRKQYPNCTELDSTKNDLYLKIVGNSMCGGTVEETENNYNKIKHNIIKQVVIQK